MGLQHPVLVLSVRREKKHRSSYCFLSLLRRVLEITWIFLVFTFGLGSSRVELSLKNNNNFVLRRENWMYNFSLHVYGVYGVANCAPIKVDKENLCGV